MPDLQPHPFGHENVSEPKVAGKVVKREESSQPRPWKLVQFTRIAFWESSEAIKRYSSVLKMFVPYTQTMNHGTLHQKLMMQCMVINIT